MPAHNAQTLQLARETLDIEAAALLGLKARLDERFLKAVDMMLGVQGRVVVTGMGKSGHIGRKIAATLASTGTPAMFVHPGRQARERGGFDFKGLARQAQGLRRVKRRGRGGADSHGRILSTGAAGGLLPGLSAVLLAAPVRSALPSAHLLQRQVRKLVTLG